MLRPSVAVAQPLAVRAFLIEDSVASVWTPAMQRSSDGALRIVGTARDPFGNKEGELRVVFAIGKEGDLPASPSAMQSVLSTEWKALSYRVLSSTLHVTPAAMK